MTHQNHQTNGATLEDCHTNFFALTELHGIKWRKLVWGESVGGGDEEGSAPLADPVISSYARCLAGDILCVWRRVPAPQPPDIYETSVPAPPPLSLRAAKELWIFWYGEEPDLNGLVAPELIVTAGQTGEQGSFESGLSYECRSLLFKALHNLIERCLLSRDFVRLGKWFVQPYDGDEEDVGKSPWHLSFSFAFFLHGESTVCASVDVRQHPPVRTLTAKRLARLNSPEHPHSAKVILAPFGLEGTLTGREWGDSDAATARLLDAWRQLYPLEQGCGAVEVVCGGVRMRYPWPYALVTEMEAMPAGAAAAHALAARQLHALTTPLPHMPEEQCYAESGEKGEDFVDPTRKTPCTCAKSGGAGGGGASACSPASCGGGSPAGAVSAPSSAGGAPPSSPHHHLQTTTTNQSSAAVPTTLHTPAPTPDPHAPPTPAPPSHHPPKLYAQGDSPPSGAAAHSARHLSPLPAELAKRPVLPSAERRVDPLEDEHSLHMLYDYTTVHAWLEHPVKRFKSQSSSFREELALGGGGGCDAELYHGHEHTLPASIHTPADVKQERHDPDDTKEYKNLFTSDGLCPNVKDLDQIFENSDDAASGDETVRLLAVQTPPDSNKSLEESRCGAARCVRAEELSKMFPTPPSMEAHAQSSPTPLPDDTTLAPQRRNSAHSPHRDTAIEDWSYVFKPPTVCKYVGSSKYAPLTSLPSQLLPPLTLPPHAVYRPRAPHAAHQTNNNNTTSSSSGEQHTAGVKRSLSPAAESRSTGMTSVAAGGGSGPPCRQRARGAWSPGRGAPPPDPPRAAACPLLLNVLLADTVLNVFRDHNFDSCTLCVCNAGPKVVGNILGADAGTYVPGGAPAEEPGRCTCGFSAVVNRRRAHRAGLFYEDEMEITGLAEEPGGGAGGGAGAGALAGEVARELLSACAAPAAAPCEALARAAAAAADLHHDHLAVNLLEYSDGGAAAAKALHAASGGAGGAGAASGVHRWPFIGARAPRSSRDVVRLMRRLRPLLQDAIQKRCCGARMWDGVTGPLTWRQFHRMAGRGNEDLCEPQPVPPLLVGHDRDWVSLSPYALRHWERLALEPYSYPRDVAYVVLAPHAPALLDPLLAFFRALSTAYEGARLGRHRPLRRVARDGLVRAPPAPNAPPGELRAYDEVLRNTLLPALAALALDRSLLESERRETRPPPAPAPAPGDPPPPEDEVPPAPVPASTWDAESEGGAPALVLYVVEPPGRGGARALHALLRLAARASHHLHHHAPLVKIISLQAVVEAWGLGAPPAPASAPALAPAPARALAFSVYCGARRTLHHHADGKSLTGFGTAAAANLFLRNKDEKSSGGYRLFSPAWVLGRARACAAAGEPWAAPAEGAVLFLAYCLSHDQRWLLAAATDARGELLDTAAINIHVPPRSRRSRRSPARRLGLTKLMDFTLGVMSQAAQPWRLVVGRVGRIGHGELKGWSWLLSRKHLSAASAALREMCGACSALPVGAAPAILSACLVSTEPEPALRLMADRFTPDERFAQHSLHSALHTPRDVTATHILVFPTSATTQSNQNTFEQPMANGEDNDMMLFNDIGDMGEEDDNDIDGIFDTEDMIDSMFAASPRRVDSDAFDEAAAAHAACGGGGAPRAGCDGPAQEPVGAVLQQPLALGYTVSTAPLPAMPVWWWAACPHLRGACPAFLRTALHLHAGSLQAADDFGLLVQRRDHNAHALDSQLTTDVLRYVLEGYNALSWLALDPATADRVSCLPLHVQVLMQLYHTAAALH